LPEEIFQLKRVFHVSTVKAWRDVYLPASATAFVTGSITAIGAAWNTLIIAEYFSSKDVTTQVNTGIGKIIAVATNHNPADLLTLYLAIASMTVLTTRKRRSRFPSSSTFLSRRARTNSS